MDFMIRKNQSTQVPAACLQCSVWPWPRSQWAAHGLLKVMVGHGGSS